MYIGLCTGKSQLDVAENGSFSGVQDSKSAASSYLENSSDDALSPACLT